MRSQPGETRARASRREFLTGGTQAGAAPPAWQPPPLRPPSRTRARVRGAGERLRIGVIGTGGMGTEQIRLIVRENGLAGRCNVEVSAVCDVYQPRLDHAARLSGGRPFRNYQDLLTSGLVDGVVLTTPEHWHCRMALDALACGLDVYCQKPMTRTLDEARELHEAFRKSDRVFQLGTQGVQQSLFRTAREVYLELREADRLGPPILAQASACRNSREGEWNYPMDRNARPGQNLDWRAFLGPLPFEEYRPQLFFQWRKYRQFSAGPISDLLAHSLQYIGYAMGGPDLPVAAACMGGIFAHPDDRTVPDTTLVSVDYGDHLLLLYSSTATSTHLPTLIRCHRGDLLLGGRGGGIRVTPQRAYADREFRERVREVPPDTEDATALHMAEWFDCMRTRQKTTCDIEAAWRGMTAIALAQEAYAGGQRARL